MTRDAHPIFIGDTALKHNDDTASGSFVMLSGEMFYQIKHFDALEPFLMSLVSSSDHWLFIASTGGLSAGRGRADHALFPYYTEDKITENSENTGSKSIFLVTRAGRTSLWEPFAFQQRRVYAIQRNLYKNVPGTTLIFEEINLSLGLVFRYAWRTSERFGFVRTAWLRNPTEFPCRVELVDGVQNILPAHVATEAQNALSCLLDAYKRNELDLETGLGIFALSSVLTDLAEPKESLLATTVAQVGLSPQGFLLSSAQLDRFRTGLGIVTETEVRGRRGAYFVHATLDLAPDQEHTWHLTADVDQDGSAVARTRLWLRTDTAAKVKEIEDDLAANNAALWEIVAKADGMQLTNSSLYCAHHFANTLFNVMRGGIFADYYTVRRADFVENVSVRSRDALQTHAGFFAALPAQFDISTLQARAKASGSADLVRLSFSYLPLMFGRRHGDPSRPWNRFSIDIRKPDGSARLGYEGNWRDIFQNWEVLAYSYPKYVEHMIAVFLNATTADGYNPYRITYDGIDWEVPEPDNPWSNIGYWSDHQIIYLLKLMEASARLDPGRLKEYLNWRIFSHANVPYRIKPYSELVRDPFNTIVFDEALHHQIEARQKEMGTDARLLTTRDGSVFTVSLAEKLLTLLLAKLVNFVPEGGIWMNTQRPEWNDANNALVGKGLSVVTLCYLRRFIVFWRHMFSTGEPETVALTKEVHQLYQAISNILHHFRQALQGAVGDTQRRQIMDALGEAGSAYRQTIYEDGFSGDLIEVSVSELVAFLDLTNNYIEHALRANRRDDHLYHAYNTLRIGDSTASIGHLYVMLEGQVAALSSGLLSGDESLDLLTSLQESALYLPEQHSYILYPDQTLPGFLTKNSISREQVADIRLIDLLVQAGDTSLLIRDIEGTYHFSGKIHNVQDVAQALQVLAERPEYAELVRIEAEKVRALFEATFHHEQFTGRSGTFFAYEGLGSIYWHMVAKLLVAVQETSFRLSQEACADALREKYTQIRAGLGFNKPPAVYGAFPTDPYSHTPKGKGAKQPGLTGLVKEEILTRFAELGFTVADGKLVFDAFLINAQELLEEPTIFRYLDVNGRRHEISVGRGALAYTICQTPVVVQASDSGGITVIYTDGHQIHIDGNVLDRAHSERIFSRDGGIEYLRVQMQLPGSPS